ncbi:hypothetical protein L6164_009364 [Bauhinia variegata]|uniref:Uncharacterized protein n=1 Tax=Bauhinia variegata TaxID=167791 RepID=A0ACB9PJP6_BAUVA|nr:hypothetical protein L6164_009364 [Bauhinia variegata]
MIIAYTIQIAARYEQRKLVNSISAQDYPSNNVRLTSSKLMWNDSLYSSLHLFCDNIFNTEISYQKSHPSFDTSIQQKSSIYSKLKECIQISGLLKCENRT